MIFWLFNDEICATEKFQQKTLIADPNFKQVWWETEASS